MRVVWADGVQRVVHVLQELEEDGAVDDSVCGEVVIPGGELSFVGVVFLLLSHCKTEFLMLLSFNSLIF